MRLIDADAEIEKLEQFNVSGRLFKDMVDFAVEVLTEAQTAQKTGHWIPLIKDEPLDPRVKCSECGNTEILHCGNYCPNCGAYMGGEEDVEESD